jgi:hypothetical protein
MNVNKTKPGLCMKCGEELTLLKASKWQSSFVCSVKPDHYALAVTATGERIEFLLTAVPSDNVTPPVPPSNYCRCQGWLVYRWVGEARPVCAKCGQEQDVIWLRGDDHAESREAA